MNPFQKTRVAFWPDKPDFYPRMKPVPDAPKPAKRPGRGRPTHDQVGKPYAAERRGHSIHPVVQRLKAWRARNGLSQANAVDVLQKYYFHLSLPGLRAWEEGRRSPAPHTAETLDRFLHDHPTVKAP